tara:strand:+ start:344 stop:658 length:315 start_codon:yes stop_codon:yes gene_type:complete
MLNGTLLLSWNKYRKTYADMEHITIDQDMYRREWRTSSTLSTDGPVGQPISLNLALFTVWKQWCQSVPFWIWTDHLVIKSPIYSAVQGYLQIYWVKYMTKTLGV